MGVEQLAMATHCTILGPVDMIRSHGRSPLLSATLCFWLFSVTLSGVAQDTRFDIWKGNDLIGSVLARKTVSHDRTLYLMTSYSEIDMIWKQVIRSLVSTEYRNGTLSTCNSHVKVNGSVRDSSHFTTRTDDMHCYVHPDQRFAHHDPVAWTTARMYFEEPVGQKTIFVESVLKHCALQPLGNGQYRLTLPDGKVNRYLYTNGRLEEIHVDRSLFDLVFRRDG